MSQSGQKRKRVSVDKVAAAVAEDAMPTEDLKNHLYNQLGLR